MWKTEDGVTLYYDNHEQVRFCIESEEWHDQTPVGPNQKDEEGNKPPYTITATMEEAGLGPCLWWDGDDEEAA